MIPSQTLRRVAWLLLVSVLFQAFLVSGAFARLEQGAEPHRTQICSASGLQTIALDSSGPASGTASLHHDHCALCGCLGADIPASAIRFQAIRRAHSPFIAAREHIQRERAANLRPPSRAPPAVL